MPIPAVAAACPCGLVTVGHRGAPPAENSNSSKKGLGSLVEATVGCQSSFVFEV